MSRQRRAGPTTPGTSGPRESCEALVLYHSTAASAPPHGAMVEPVVETHWPLATLRSGDGGPPGASSAAPDQCWKGSVALHGATNILKGGGPSSVLGSRHSAWGHTRLLPP